MVKEIPLYDIIAVQDPWISSIHLSIGIAPFLFPSFWKVIFSIWPFYRILIINSVRVITS